MRHLTSTLMSSLEDKVEQQIAFSVKVLQNLPSAILTKPSAAGGWSIVQVLDHLNSYGDYYLPLMQSAIKKSPEEITLYFNSGVLGDYFVKMINPVSGTKKIKAAKRHQPGEIKNPQQVVDEFIRQEELLLQLLFKARKVNLAGSRIPISIARVIRLKLGDILQFVVNHVDRHMVQINHLLAGDEVYAVYNNDIIFQTNSAR